MNSLREMIDKQIIRQGVIPFAKFMELALYCPELGYYERKMDSVGPRGDFFTAVSVGSLFGELLGLQFAAWLDAARGESTGPIQIVEAGAHDGRLAGDVLNCLRNFQPEIFHRLEYWILEPSLRRQAWQQTTLAPFSAQVRWFQAWEQFPVPGVNGLIFSNELLDAFPVRRIGWDAANQSFFEWGVARERERFIWARMPLQNGAETNPGSKGKGEAADSWEALFGLKLTPELLAVLPDGFTTEVCPAATTWWRQAAGALHRGRLVTIDYGLTAEEFFHPQRAGGTLRAYRRHHLGTDVLEAPGEQDLTAHVNFSAIQSAGEAAGLRTDSCETQARFLIRLAGQAECPGAAFQKWTPARVRQFQTLTHPEHLGRAFRVLVQSR